MRDLASRVDFCNQPGKTLFVVFLSRIRSKEIGMGKREPLWSFRWLDRCSQCLLSHSTCITSTEAAAAAAAERLLGISDQEPLRNSIWDWTEEKERESHIEKEQDGYTGGGGGLNAPQALRTRTYLRTLSCTARKTTHNLLPHLIFESTRYQDEPIQRIVAG